MTAVLHLCRRFFPQRGGSETYTGALIPELRELGVNNRILAMGTPDEEYHWHDIPVLRTGDLAREDGAVGSRFVSQFVQILDLHKPDVVHWHFLPDDAALLLDACAVRNVKSVHTLHHPASLCAHRDLIRFDREVCDREPNRLNCGPCMSHFHGIPRSLASAFTTVTRLVPSQIKRRLPPSRIKTSLTLADDVGRWTESQRQSLGRFDKHVVLSAASVHVMARSGVDLERVVISRLGTHHAPPNVLNRIDWHVVRRPMRVIFVGRLDDEKGVVTLAEAASSFTRSELQLDIYGMPGDAVAQINAIVQKPDSAVRYLGHLQDGDVVDRMSEYDYVAIPSQFFETGPFTAVEAMQAGTPVLASNIASLNELIRHGDNGWLATPGQVDAWRDALRYATDQPALANSMRGQLTYPRTMRDVAMDMTQVYREVMSRKLETPTRPNFTA